MNDSYSPDVQPAPTTDDVLNHFGKDTAELLEAFGKLDSARKHQVLGYAQGLAELAEGGQLGLMRPKRD